MTHINLINHAGTCGHMCISAALAPKPRSDVDHSGKAPATPHDFKGCDRYPPAVKGLAESIL